MTKKELVIAILNTKKGKENFQYNSIDQMIKEYDKRFLIQLYNDFVLGKKVNYIVFK